MRSQILEIWNEPKMEQNKPHFSPFCGPKRSWKCSILWHFWSLKSSVKWAIFGPKKWATIAENSFFGLNLMLLFSTHFHHFRAGKVIYFQPILGQKWNSFSASKINFGAGKQISFSIRNLIFGPKKKIENHPKIKIGPENKIEISFWAGKEIQFWVQIEAKMASFWAKKSRNRLKIDDFGPFWAQFHRNRPKSARFLRNRRLRRELSSKPKTSAKPSPSQARFSASPRPGSLRSHLNRGGA